MLKHGKAQFGALVALIMSLAGVAREKWADPAAPFDAPSNGIQRAANAGTIIAVVVIGVVSLVGILIFAQIDEALPEPENADLAGASDGLSEGFAGAMELVPIVLLILIAALVIGVVQRMRTNGGGM